MSSSDKKKVENGARTISSFYNERDKGMIFNPLLYFIEIMNRIIHITFPNFQGERNLRRIKTMIISSQIELGEIAVWVFPLGTKRSSVQRWAPAVQNSSCFPGARVGFLRVLWFPPTAQNKTPTHWYVDRLFLIVGCANLLVCTEFIVHMVPSVYRYWMSALPVPAAVLYSWGSGPLLKHLPPVPHLHLQTHTQPYTFMSSKPLPLSNKHPQIFNRCLSNQIQRNI